MMMIITIIIIILTILKRKVTNAGVPGEKP